MLCEHCQKRPATTHITRTVNGKTTQLNLCAHCAAEQGFHSAFGFDLNDFWGSLFSLRQYGQKSLLPIFRIQRKQSFSFSIYKFTLFKIRSCSIIVCKSFFNALAKLSDIVNTVCKSFVSISDNGFNIRACISSDVI